MGKLEKKRGKTNISGLAGDIEFYTIKGETFFKTHAKKHKKSRSKKAVSGRSNFASVVKLAKETIKIPELKEIWSHSKLKGMNEFQKLIKYNMPLAYEGDLTIKNFITHKGLNLYIPDISLEDFTLSFTFDVYGLIKPPLKLHMFIYMYNRKMKDSSAFSSTSRSISINQDDISTLREKGESKYNMKVKLVGDEKKFLSDYKDVLVLFAVTGTPTIPNRKSWTNTVGFDIPLI
jgi:hypothetical protein